MRAVFPYRVFFLSQCGSPERVSQRDGPGYAPGTSTLCPGILCSWWPKRLHFRGCGTGERWGESAHGLGELYLDVECEIDAAVVSDSLAKLTAMPADKLMRAEEVEGALRDDREVFQSLYRLETRPLVGCNFHDGGSS